jgi:hypothetical protein
MKSGSKQMQATSRMTSGVSSTPPARLIRNVGEAWRIVKTVAIMLLGLLAASIGGHAQSPKSNFTGKAMVAGLGKIAFPEGEWSLEFRRVQAPSNDRQIPDYFVFKRSGDRLERPTGATDLPALPAHNPSASAWFHARYRWRDDGQWSSLGVEERRKPRRRRDSPVESCAASAIRHGETCYVLVHSCASESGSFVAMPCFPVHPGQFCLRHRPFVHLSHQPGGC